MQLQRQEQREEGETLRRPRPAHNNARVSSAHSSDVASRSYVHEGMSKTC